MIIEIKKVKQLTDQEKSDIKKFLIPCFSKFPSFASSVYTSPELETCILLKNGNNIIAHASIVMRMVKHDSKVYKIGGVGNVAVRRDLRHKSFGSKVLQKTDAVLKEGKYNLGLLFCHPKLDNFYTNCGWIKNGKVKFIIRKTATENMKAPAIFSRLI